MVDKDILFLKKGNRQTIVKKANKQLLTMNVLLEEYLNDLCLKDLTTLEGRIKAVSTVYNIKKHIPVYLTQDVILTPIKNKKDPSNIYINCCNVIELIKDKDFTKVIFSDFSILEIEQEFHLIKKYINFGLKINKSKNIRF